MTATQVCRIDEVAVVFNGKTPSKSEQRDSGHPVLKVKDVDALGRFRGTFSGHVGTALARKHVKQQLAGGETLVLNAAHNATHVASKTFYADREVVGSLATGEWLIVRWSTETVDSRFGNHWINAPDTRFRIRRLVNGIHLYPKDVARLKIPLPPLAEQRRIARILDAADALRTKRREALAQLDTLIQSTFLDMFGDPVINPMGLRRETLKSAFEFTTGKLDSNAAVEGGKYPFFTCARETSAIDDYAFDCEALLLAGNNANADYSVKHYKGRFNAYQRTYVITIKDSALTYAYVRLVLEYLLGDLKRFSKGTNTKYLTMVILNRMPILVPPLDLQSRFAAVVESVEQQRASQRAHLAELDTLFASLQSRAFRGEL